MEGVINAGVRKAGFLVYGQKRRGVPADCDVNVIEQAFAHHVGFRRAALFGGTAVVSHGGVDVVCFDPVFQRGGREHGCCAKHVVAAAVAVRPFGDRVWFNLARVLRQAWQCVVFAEDRDDWAACACFANYGSGQASGVVGDAKSLFHQQFAVGSAGFEFRVEGFGRVEHIVGHV